MKFKKRDVKLKPNHHWKTPEGYQLIVLDRGAVHICFPQGWEVTPGKITSIKLHDAAPPDDNCRMEISYFRIPPIMSRAFPFERAMKVVENTETDLEHYDKQPPAYLRRDGLRFGWIESKYADPENGRAVCSRALLVYGNNVQVLITYDCWADEMEKFAPVWNTLLKTIRLGEYVANPATGQIIKPHLN